MGQNVQEFRTFIIARENPCSMEQAARTAAAAVLSLLGARVLGLPEGYWAAISTLIVMQSSLAAALPISVQRSPVFRGVHRHHRRPGRHSSLARTQGGAGQAKLALGWVIPGG